MNVAAPPPLPTADGDGYDPTRLIVGDGDALGIDRRRRPRGSGASPPDELADVVYAAHTRVRVPLALCSRHGSALVETITLCPTGVIVRLLDPTDPELSEAERAAVRRAFVGLLPGLATSPLAAAGVAVLGRRLVRDLSRWAQTTAGAGERGDPPSEHRGTGLRRGRRPRFPVQLRPLAPAPAPAPAPAGTAGTTAPSQGPRTPSRCIPGDPIPGELAPLTDPSPEIVAIALGAPAHARLAALAR